MHKEDVKAELKKRFRSVAAFERANALPEKSVADVLRGRASARVIQAIEAALATPVPLQSSSEVSDDSPAGGAVHRLNAEAR